jgi:glucoamylase
LRSYVLLAPHLGATGYGNRAVLAEHRGRRFLSAERSPFAMALAAVDERQQDAIIRTSAGYVGASDGWQDFARNGRMAWEYPAAGPGNVALLAELPRFSVLALGDTGRLIADAAVRSPPGSSNLRLERLAPQLW